jgi:hypothetical protein
MDNPKNHPDWKMDSRQPIRLSELARLDDRVQRDVDQFGGDAGDVSPPRSARQVAQKPMWVKIVGQQVAVYNGLSLVTPLYYFQQIVDYRVSDPRNLVMAQEFVMTTTNVPYNQSTPSQPFIQQTFDGGCYGICYEVTGKLSVRIGSYQYLTPGYEQEATLYIPDPMYQQPATWLFKDTGITSLDDNDVDGLNYPIFGGTPILLKDPTYPAPSELQFNKTLQGFNSIEYLVGLPLSTTPGTTVLMQTAIGFLNSWSAPFLTYFDIGKDKNIYTPDTAVEVTVDMVLADPTHNGIITVGPQTLNGDKNILGTLLFVTGTDAAQGYYGVRVSGSFWSQEVGGSWYGVSLPNQVTGPELTIELVDVATPLAPDPNSSTILGGLRYYVDSLNYQHFQIRQPNFGSPTLPGSPFLDVGPFPNPTNQALLGGYRIILADIQNPPNGVYITTSFFNTVPSVTCGDISANPLTGGFNFGICSAGFINNGSIIPGFTGAQVFQGLNGFFIATYIKGVLVGFAPYP